MSAIERGSARRVRYSFRGSTSNSMLAFCSSRLFDLQTSETSFRSSKKRKPKCEIDSGTCSRNLTVTPSEGVLHAPFGLSRKNRCEATFIEFRMRADFRQRVRLLLARDSSGPKETNEVPGRINNRNCVNLVLLH